MTALGITATGWLAISALAGTAATAANGVTQASQQRKALRNQQAAQADAEAQSARAERQAMEAQQRAAREVPDLAGIYDRERRNRGAGGSPLAADGPLSLGGNSLLGI